MSANTEERKIKNREAVKRYAKKYPDRVLLAQRKRNQKRRKIIIDKYGGKCACCGETEIKFLSIDHINGGGNKHRRKVVRYVKASGSFYLWVIQNNFPKLLQILCYNCNLAKGFYGHCPHKDVS